MKSNVPSRKHLVMHLLAFGLFLFLGPTAAAQLIDHPFEEVGDETYAAGGFGTFNWVDPTAYGITAHAGAQGFLSAYTGTPIANIGMNKPLGGAMANTTYRVSFYITKYALQAVPFTDFNALYVGSANGTSVWDTIPTPALDGAWLKWSGTFTPDAADIGQPFVFGFSMTLNSGVSFAMDGPVVVQDLATGMPRNDGTSSDLEVRFTPGMPYITVRCLTPIVEMVVVDAQGRMLSTDQGFVAGDRHVDTLRLPPGHYFVRCICADGSVRVGRFVVV